jgi:hypothetical protein
METMEEARRLRTGILLQALIWHLIELLVAW